MIALAVLLQAAVPAPSGPAMPPTDWSLLPDLPVAPPRGASDPSAFVRREVVAGRCRLPPGGGGAGLTAPVAVLVDARGSVQRIMPRAIGCPTVEQFTAGYVSTLVRRAAIAGQLFRPGWHRYAVTYRWAG